MFNLKLLLTLFFTFYINTSLFADNIENYYSSINADYTVSEGDIEGDGYQLDLLYQVTGGDKSGLALLMTNSTTSVDEIDNTTIDPAISFNIDQTSYGLGYIFKNADWHIIPYFTSMDIDLEQSGGLNDFDETLESTTFGIIFRKALSSSLTLTYNLNRIDFDENLNTVTVDGVDYLIEDNTALSFKIEQTIGDSLSLTYGIRHIDGTNTLSAGLSFTF